jgi:hypothetical protein
VDAERLLLDERVVAHGIQLQVRREGDRSERAVERERDVVRLRHRGDLPRLGDPARMRWVGLHDVDVPVGEDALEVPPRVQSLAERDRRRAVVGDLLERFRMLGQHRLLDEHQPERLELLRDHLGHRPVHATVEIDADAEVLSHRLADRLHARQHRVDLRVRVDDLHLLGGVHLHRRESARAAVPRHRRRVGRPVAADPRVDADAIAQLATQQRVHGNAERLALDVPQRLIDPGEGAHVHAAAAVESAAVQHRPVILDQRRILADQIVGQLLDGGGDRVRASLEHRLTPPGDPLVRLDLEEAPPRRDDERGERSDLHRCSDR